MVNVTYPQTLNSLTAELERYVEDDTEEYTTDLPNIIARAQDKLAQDLDLDMFREVVVETLTISSALLDRPTDCLVIRSIYIPDTNTYVELASLELCKLLGGSGAPRKYADLDTESVYLAPTPDQDYAVHIDTLKRPTPLADSNQTNWFTDNVPDLLLWACLIESENYLIDEGGRVDQFRAMYAERLGAAKAQYAGLERKDAVVRGAPPPQQPAA